MIAKIEEGLMLYHGSYCEVREPDLSKCALNKDFGKGFYLTSDIDQAKAFSKISTVKAKRHGLVPEECINGVVSSFLFRKTTDLEIKIFENADVEWLRNIVGHRINNDVALLSDDEKYDIIAGKIANDSTNATLIAYMNGLYGEPGTKESEHMCISLLLPERLKDQFCFRTERALKCLEFVSGEKVWMK